MITQFLNVPSKPKIYVCLPPPMVCNFNTDEDVQRFNNNIIPALKNVVFNFNQQGINIKIINVNGALLDIVGNSNLNLKYSDYSNYYNDCVHPNKNGNLIIANTVYQAITTN